MFKQICRLEKVCKTTGYDWHVKLQRKKYCTIVTVAFTSSVIKLEKNKQIKCK